MHVSLCIHVNCDEKLINNTPFLECLHKKENIGKDTDTNIVGF